jgi:hypothetical protein
MPAEAGHAVGQAEERGDGGDVPDVLVVKAVGMQGGKVASPISSECRQTFIAKSSMARWRGVMSALR